MANVVITPLANTGFSGSFVNQLNNNLTKLAEAVNNGVLWRATPSTGQTSMSTDLNINGYHLFNAKVDGADLIDVKRKAYASMSLIADAKAWVDVAEQYSEDAHAFVKQALGQASVATQQAQKAAVQAASAEQWASRAASTVGAISSVVTQVDFNASSISALTKTVASNKAASESTANSLSASVTSNKASAEAAIAANASGLSALNGTVVSNKASADVTASSLSTLTSTVSSLNATVASNKTAADATASSLATLSSTVNTNKTAADATASSLSTLNTTVSGHTSSISALTTTANSALPKAGGTMTGALTMGANVINLGSDVLSSNQSCTYSTAPFWSASGYRCQQGKSGYAGSNNFYNFYWNSSSEVEVWIDTSRVGKITLAAVSDKQLKEDISYVEEDALSQVEQWKPAMFSYKARGILPKSALQMGFIANDLVAVSPECVTGKGLGEVWDENAPEGAYELVPVAIMAKMSRAIQQLSERVKQLEK
ncbi:tail fiber domain-containing protein [Pantoea agglomerans]|uniref:tail fiber domain-containing protein n=1 Tax=Enterobacter agglomerans TaxID=549 RepID=UPI0013B37E6C|nr:tail fiber domain-containing protein [Pantoea agglomerans]